MIEKLIFKFLTRLTLYKQTIFISILFSFSFFSLILDVLGKDTSVDLIISVIQPNYVYFLAGIIGSIIITKLLLDKFKKNSQFLLIHFFNVSIINIMVNCVILSMLKTSTLLSEWTEGTLPYFAVLTVFSLYYFYKILFITKKIEKQINKIA
jgi:hypothetical protein